MRPAAQPLENLIGKTLNHRFVVGDKVGEGGFGAVFRGKQIATGREVALKILHPHNVSDETIVARFRREAEACSKLRDPHTVTTYDFDETPDGILYLAMELLRGQSLHQVQKAEGPLGYERVLKILDQVAASLSEAHQNGIVHRDMKPENVFIESRDGGDHVKVLDFGIAKVVSDERQIPALTAVGQTLGTLEFMSPEQLRGQKLDGRSDLYALGMMSYEMLTGTLPFATAKSPIDIINFHMRSEPPAPSKLSDKVTIPAAVDAIILKMVAKDKDKRFADANALREEIARTQRSLDSSPDRFEAYRVVAVVGATIAIVARPPLLPPPLSGVRSAQLFGGGEGDGYSVGLRTRGVGIGGRNDRAARLSSGRPSTRPPRSSKSGAPLRARVGSAEPRGTEPGSRAEFERSGPAAARYGRSGSSGWL